MTPDEKSSDLVMKRVECTKCGAVWLNGVHMWRTGMKGNELDLAALVCNKVPAENTECINIMRGQVGGQTWEERAELIEKKLKEALDQS